MGSWSCSRCTFLNENTKRKCEMCDFENVNKEAKKHEGALEFDFNSWICKSCNCLNKKSSYICEVCSNLKDGIAEEHLMDSFSLQSASSSSSIQLNQQTSENVLLTANKNKKWTCKVCQSENEHPKFICSVCEMEDREQCELLTMEYLKEMDLEEAQPKPEETISEETKKILKFYEEENLIAGIELTRNVDTMLNLQEKKAIQDWNSRVSNMKAPFEDSSFPRTKRSIYGIGNPGSEVKWLRIKDIIPQDGQNFCIIGEEGVNTYDIEQGDLGDCWFLSALAVLAERSELLSRLLVTKEINSFGLYQVRFCKNGIWTIVEVDDYFPVNEDKKLKFSRTVNNQLWVSILEKAYAKMHGSYNAISGGLAYQAMADLTGAPCERIGFHELYQNKQLDSEFLWGKILSFKEAGFLIAASCSKKQAKKVGLLVDHSYSVLDIFSVGQLRLVKICNPWRKSNWKGDWSDQSNLWTEEIKQLVGYQQNPGVFWMSYKDFLKYFTAIEVCQVRENWYDCRSKIFLQGSSVSFRPSNTMFVISVSVPTWVVIQLIQEDHRKDSLEEENQYSDLSIFITQSKNFPRSISHPTGRTDEKLVDIKSHEVVGCVFPSVSRIVHCEALLTDPKSPSIVMPLSFNAKGSKNLVVSCYSAHPVIIKEFDFDIRTLSYTAQQALINEGGCKILDDNCFLYSGRKNDSIWFLLVNKHPTQTLRITLYLSNSTNLESSRDSLETIDCIPPKHQQILNVLSLKDSTTGYSYSAKYVFDYLSDSDQIISSPPLDIFHSHFPCK